MRDGFSKILLILFGLLLSFVFLEFALHIFLIHPQTFGRPHELYGFHNRPNAHGWYFNQRNEYKVNIKINSKGLRDREFPYEKPEGTFRILVLGDSYTAGFEVPLEDTFPKQLERLLNENSKELKFEVLNSGVMGYGTVNEFLYFNYEGYKYEPDIVILAFFSSNDFKENYCKLSGGSQPCYALVGNQLELKNFPYEYAREKKEIIRSRLRKYCKACFFIKYLKNTIIKKHRRPQKEDIPEFFIKYSTDYPLEWKEVVLVTEGIIKELDKKTQANGAELMVMIIPNGEQVYPEIWKKYLETYPQAKNKKWGLDRPNEILSTFFEEEDIIYIQLLSYFRQHAQNGENLFYNNDGHFTSNGHELTSKIIYNYLIENGSISLNGGDV